MKFEIYQDSSLFQDWRWRGVARNGKIIVEGGEGYDRLQSMTRTLRKLFPDGVHNAAVEKELARVALVRKLAAN